MITAIVLILVSALVLIFLVQLARGRALTFRGGSDEARQLRAVDIDAFRNLVDPQEEAFLRTQLSPSDFRRIQRERLRAAVDYVQAAASNAGILLHLAEAARMSPDPDVAEPAERLAESATRLRLHAFQSLAVLYVGIVFPSAKISLIRVAERYENMTRQVVMLGLQNPTKGIAALL
jgi:hypothetical protein